MTTTATPSPEDAPAAESPYAVLAGAVAPHLFVFEIQGVRSRDISLEKLTRLFYGVANDMGGSVALVTMQTMGLRTRYCGAIENGIPCQCNDVFDVLCVGTVRGGGCAGGAWGAVDATADASGRRPTRLHRGRRQTGLTWARPGLVDCFARHARIADDGTIVRNEAAADGCPACARTWCGFRVLLARAPPRERVNAARSAAITTARLGAQPTNLGAVDVMCTCTQLMRIGASLLPFADARVARAERALLGLGAEIERLSAVCLWARRLGVRRALRVAVDADVLVGAVMPTVRNARRPLFDLVVSTAVAAGVIVARANRTAAGILCGTPWLDAGVVAESVSATAGTCSALIKDPGQSDLREAAQRVADIFAQARKEIDAVVVGGGGGGGPPRNVEERQSEVDVRSADADGGMVSQQWAPEDRRDDGRPPVEAPRCSGVHCRAPKRRIVSGCAIAVHCTAGCRVTFHRACWKDIGIVPAAAVPCLTPDCWGEMARVTSSRLRTVDRVVRVLWEAAAAHNSHNSVLVTCAHGEKREDRTDRARLPAHRGAPCKSRDARQYLNGADDRIVCARSMHDQRGDNIIAGTRGDDDDGVSDGGGDDVEKRDPCCRADASAQESLAKGGRPYQKDAAPRDALPIRRKRPRNRAGKRQRRRVAQQQQQWQALWGSPDASEPIPEAPPREIDTAQQPAPANYANDALWPSFFVPDPDDGSV
ncbi:hypothetical protein psal_cds_1372 [Pandoravirus salinus]|uniref:Uncharacterized protein n=1 Tax=Pandoravirus salinus TaxID=1349410 RepID=S4W1U0_9VIRU|nr:hypothetical protein psal_cds_1372 [Pandoravirus salinus]AGO85776.1 hypothetical protein psal_cds_1372 [Pandoravirus salinus]